METDYDDQITFVAGCAAEADYIYVAAYADNVDPEEYAFSYLLSWIGRVEGEKWFYRAVQQDVVSVCVKKATPTIGRRFVSLSREGEVEIYSNKDGSTISEKIPEAGVGLGSRGYVTQIREIGNSLYVCGFADQVYRRQDDGTWTLITSAPLQIRNALDDDVGFLTSIDGSGENDIYTCGDEGRLYHFNGTAWSRLHLTTDENLNCVRCISPDEVWACGYNGTLLTGNFRDGFTDVSSIDDNETFWSLTKFQGKIYTSTAGEQLFVYDGSSIQPETEFPSGLMTYKLDSVPDMLWSFSPKEIAYFDGTTWTRVNHRSNPIAD
ncbi:hypothetical protein OU994_11175 [Pseudoduganella sp. SL102]|uniref:WD40/YVTN/BNR-like repeat-containing protein n=1 Tax=Pseudoduganella sp. SL102 TaxID=2995154 RepID=UPI00248CC46D|nr:hypothetical protein [Pseudoduganella sp. SL102]WBS04789.1 hypothetical protein OU994_11175 [Pseudoduganella sp. SL102]